MAASLTQINRGRLWPLKLSISVDELARLAKGKLLDGFFRQ